MEKTGKKEKEDGYRLILQRGHSTEAHGWSSHAERHRRISTPVLFRFATQTCRQDSAASEPWAPSVQQREGGSCSLCVLPVWSESCHKGTVTVVGRWSPPRPRAGTLRMHADTQQATLLCTLGHSPRGGAAHSQQRLWKTSWFQPPLLLRASYKSSLLPLHTPHSLLRGVTGN